MLNPILSFSATRRMRSFRTLLIIGAYVGCMLIIALLIQAPLLRPAVTITAGRNGLYAYVALIAVQMGLIVLITPAITSGAIAGERDRQTLELLLVTQTGSFRIVMGKMLESLAMLGLLLLCGFPVMCLCMLSGSVKIGSVLLGELFLLSTAFGAAAVGVFCSTLARNTVMSTVFSYLMIAAIGAGTALSLLNGYPQRVTDILYDGRRFAELTPGAALGMTHLLLFLNPAYGLLALLQGQTGLLTDNMEYREWGRILATWKLMEASGFIRTALICAASVALAGALLLALAAILLRPRERKLRMRRG